MKFSYPWQFIGRRSAMMAKNGMVATSQPLAALSALRVLENGGNAADAAVTAAAVLNVVEPHMSGIGGDMFALVHFNNQYQAYNGSGGAPEEANLSLCQNLASEQKTESEFQNLDTQPTEDELKMPTKGGLSVTTPGALAGWNDLLEKYGTISLSEAFEPAIKYARDGFPVSEYISWQWSFASNRITPYPETARTYLPGGSPPTPGDIFSNTQLADTFELIAKHGISEFYNGKLGKNMVEAVQKDGGLLSRSDLEEHKGVWCDPICTNYRGIDILEAPPNGQGLIALEAINIAENFDLPPSITDPDRIHTLVETFKIAVSDGHKYISDPAMVDIPMKKMLSKKYAQNRAEEIGESASSYIPKAGPNGNDTVYISVVDGDGNAVSFINSVFMAFGSGMSSNGFLLHNRGCSFSLNPKHANCISPHKRPFHTIIPAMLRKNGEFKASWGVMGGSMQPQGHLQVLLSLVDLGLNPQAAMDAPRFRWVNGNKIALETSRIPNSTVAELRKKGHDVLEEHLFFNPREHFGGGQFIYSDKNDTLIGGSDPRRDGIAIGY
ncbi:MAG: gamma-glutamyltransferase [Halobacteriales archaeon]|nr:gamma-glutamyltransferase [Halobacteriales archaeon]